MNRAALMRVVELAHAAAHNATVAAANSDLNQAKAQQYHRLTEDAFYAALEALSEAGSGSPPSFLPIAAEIISPERTAA